MVICILNCILTTNFIIDLENRWTTWSAWSQCSVTCNGGTQTRVRICEDNVNAIVDSCIGSPNQTRVCNEWYCPGICLIVTIITYFVNLYKIVATFT